MQHPIRLSHHSWLGINERRTTLKQGTIEWAAMVNLLIVDLSEMATILPHCFFPISPTAVQLRLMGMPLISQVVEQRKIGRLKRKAGVCHSQLNSCSEGHKNKKKELQNRMSGLWVNSPFPGFKNFKQDTPTRCDACWAVNKVFFLINIGLASRELQLLESSTPSTFQTDEESVEDFFPPKTTYQRIQPRHIIKKCQQQD